MTEPTRIIQIDEELRLVIHKTHAYLVGPEGGKVSRDERRNPLDDDKTWHARAKLWARQVAEFISPAN